MQSFALKIESGRFSRPRALEDFFACTVVVANSTEISEAEELIGRKFAIERRRPPRTNATDKRADSFLFDDLRLYVSIPDTPNEPPRNPIGLIFEVQIKTFLQHAWTIATHDLVYKTDDANWGKERIAYQIKAMLEHAEISIQEADKLAESAVLAKEERRTEIVKKGIALVKRQWSADELPPDVRRLAQNIIRLVKGLDLDLEHLERILEDGRVARGGSHPTNLSPYGTVVQYLFNAERERMLRFLRKSGTDTKVVIPEEIELPADMNPSEFRNAIVVSGKSE